MYLNEVHHPERVALQYRNIIEDLYTNSSRRNQKLIGAITRISIAKGPAEADLAAVATALAANSERFGPAPQILLDVTIVADSLDLQYRRPTGDACNPDGSNRRSTAGLSH